MKKLWMKIKKFFSKTLPLKLSELLKWLDKRLSKPAKQSTFYSCAIIITVVWAYTDLMSMIYIIFMLAVIAVCILNTMLKLLEKQDDKKGGITIHPGDKSRITIETSQGDYPKTTLIKT